MVGRDPPIGLGRGAKWLSWQKTLISVVVQGIWADLSWQRVGCVGSGPVFIGVLMEKGAAQCELGVSNVG